MRRFKTFLVSTLLLALAVPADACFFRHRRARRRVCAPVVRHAAPTPQTRLYATSPAPGAFAFAQSGPVDSGLAAVNQVRANHGLSPLALDLSLQATARANSARGFNHWGYHSGWEAVASTSSVQSALAMWMNDKPHRDVVLSPTTRGAIVTVNGITTLQTR